MRFLCLHGHGTNSQILESQLELLRANLPRDWEFEFLDGEIETPPAPGVQAIFPGPYLCYYGEPIPSDVLRAQALLIQVVREEGPFDGVIGFSQGAALAAAVIATQYEDDPSEELFRIAVFIAASMPFDIKGERLQLTYGGVGAGASAGALSATRSDAAEEGAAGQESERGDYWLNDCRSASVIQEFEMRRPQLGAQQEPLSMEVLLRYHPTTHRQRLHLPTVHVVGEKDSYRDQGLDLVELCNSGTRKAQLIHHQGGHELPRDAATVAKLAEAMLEAAEKMRFES